MEGVVVSGCGCERVWMGGCLLVFLNSSCYLK